MACLRLRPVSRVALAYGCCIGSWTRLGAYVMTQVDDAELIGFFGQRSIPVAYNLILNSYRDRKHDDLVVLLHDDLEVTDSHMEKKLRAAFVDPDVALVGVAGGRATNGLAWWGADPIGHQLIDTGLIDFGVREGDVDSIEGSFMVLSPWAVEHLRFDTRFTGFHGYDDIGMCARALGKRVVVVDVDTHHHTVAGFKSPEDEAAWVEADRRFREKWNL